MNGSRWRRHPVFVKPTQRLRGASILLLPDLVERLNGRHVQEPLIGSVLPDPSQHLEAILSHRFPRGAVRS
jgi:hypothetical protein